MCIVYCVKVQKENNYFNQKKRDCIKVVNLIEDRTEKVGEGWRNSEKVGEGRRRLEK